jgi:predicted aspartyl protease
MKLLFSIIAVFTMALGFSKDYKSLTNESRLESGFSKAAPCTISVNWRVTGKLRKKPDCIDFGLSCLKIENVKPCDEFSISNQDSENTNFKLVYLSNTEFILYFFNDTRDTFLLVEDEIKLPAIMCNAYKKLNITILPGKYTLTKERDGASSTRLRVNSK